MKLISILVLACALLAGCGNADKTTALKTIAENCDGTLVMSVTIGEFFGGSSVTASCTVDKRKNKNG